MEYYKDAPNIAVDCLMELMKTSKSIWLQEEAAYAIEQLGYCPDCGSKLVLIKYKEYHTEVDTLRDEPMCFYQCPICGG